MIRQASILVFGVVVIVLGGCRKAPRPKIVAVEGVVLLDGKPLNKALVRFFPSMQAGPDYIATGVTDESGRFHLTCKAGPGACVGENQVLVLEAELPSHLKGEGKGSQLAEYFKSLGGRPLPKKYANLVNSPLTVDVKDDQTEYKFDLER